MKITKLRTFSLIFVTALASWLGLRHQYPVLNLGLGAGPIDRYCPFGGVEIFFSYLASGSYLAKTGFSNFVLLAATLILVVITGASFCGWLCPLGGIQEWLAKLGKKILGKNLSITGPLHENLRYLRFVVLAVIMFFTFKMGTLVFADYDPYKIFFHFRFETYTAIVIMMNFIVFSILVERFWCKYLCPFGAVFAIFAPFSLFKIHRDSSSCINCNLCTKACPVGIDVAKIDTVPESKCIKCLDCVEACPEAEALNLTFGKPQEQTGGIHYEG